MSKQASELLASRLKEKNCLTSDTRITAYRTREKSFLPYFSQDEKLLYCNNIHGLFMQLGISEYKSDNWRLFIDSSTRSLKCVLLHNTNQYAFISIANSATLEEEYEDIKIILQKIRYNEHQWSICVDLRMVNYLLGQQKGYTKYPCFICLWDSRAKDDHWKKKIWPAREKLDCR